jgi:hypothetical protein
MILKGEPVNFTPLPEELEGVQSTPPNPVILQSTHHLHDPSRCGVIQLGLADLFEGGNLTGEFPLLVRRMGSFKGYSESLGIGLQAFVGELLVGQAYLPPEETGAETFPLPVDLRAISPGVHLLRVVITDFADHYGTRSVKFRKP